MPTVPTIPAVNTKIIDCDSVPSLFKDLKDGVDYIIKCQILIKDKVLVIDPGVTIQFEGKNSGIVIHEEFSGGGLRMVGTAAKPIILQGKDATRGNWLGVILGSRNLENKWEYVTIRDAGGGERPAGLLLENFFANTSLVSIKNCSFINNLGYGISDYHSSISYTSSVFTSFENNKFIDNEKSALQLNIGFVGGLDESSSYDNNGQKYIEVTGVYGPNMT